MNNFKENIGNFKGKFNSNRKTQNKRSYYLEVIFGFILFVTVSIGVYLLFLDGIDKTDYTKESEDSMYLIFGLLTGSIIVTYFLIKINPLGVLRFLYLIPLSSLVYSFYLFFMITPIGEEKSAVGAFISAIASPDCADAFPITAERYKNKNGKPGVFSDPIDGGTCWVCPDGYSRTANPVNGPHACVKNSPANIINTVYTPPSSDIIDPKKEGDTCRSGYTYDRIKKVCWKCPDGYTKLKFPIDPKKTCYKKVDCKKIIGVTFCSRVYSPPGHVEFPGKDTCPDGYVAKTDIFGSIKKCIKPPTSLPIYDKYGLTSASRNKVGELTQIEGKPVSDPGHWIPVALNNNLRLRPEAIKKLENMGYSIDGKTPDLMHTCPAPNSELLIEVPEMVHLDPNQPNFAVSLKSVSRRTINPDLSANTACEVLTNAAKISTLDQAGKLIRIYESGVDPKNSNSTGLKNVNSDSTVISDNTNTEPETESNQA